MQVAIVGCGHISRAHIRALQKIGDAEISAVCDWDQWRARETAELAHGAKAYVDLAQLLKEQAPDVVHILTPPYTHADLAIQAMEAGCHVLVEKPMALSVQEADRMIVVAKRRGVKLCADHNYLFKPAIVKATQLLESGVVGQVVHVSSFYGLYGEGVAYLGRAGCSHWAWRLPGGAFTNFLPHLVYLQLAFLQRVDSVAGVTLSPEAEGHEYATEMSALLLGSSASGIMTFSMRAKPYAKFVDIYGTKGIIHADLVRETCTIHRERRLPRMLSKAAFNLEDSVQLASGTAVTTAKVLLGRMGNMPGLQVLMREFYSSIRDNVEPPVTGEDGRSVAKVMEMTWAEFPRPLLPPGMPSEASALPGPKTDAERVFAKRRKTSGRVLVIGATGFLGHHLVSALARCGASVVALVRDRSGVSPKLEQQAELVYGDLRDPVSIESAMRDVDIVYHCAAITRNSVSWTTHYEINVRGTETVLIAALEAGVRRVLHVSTVLVYGLEPPSRDTLISESAQYAADPDRWAYYMRAKIEADKSALRFYRERGLPVTVVRLGILYGPDGGRLSARGLLQLGALRLLIGSGHNRLPYTYVGNAIDFLLLATVSAEAVGQAYNVVDEPQVTVREVIAKILEQTGERGKLVSVPAWLLSAAAGLLEWKNALTKSAVPPRLSRFVVQSACRNVEYATSKARQQLGWRSAVTLEEGLSRMLQGQS